MVIGLKCLIYLSISMPDNYGEEVLMHLSASAEHILESVRNQEDDR